MLINFITIYNYQLMESKNDDIIDRLPKIIKKLEDEVQNMILTYSA